MVNIEGSVSIVQQELDLTKILMHSQATLHRECNYGKTCRNSKDELK